MQVSIDDLLPIRERNLIRISGRHTAAGIVKQNIKPLIFVIRCIKEMTHGVFIRHVRWYDERPFTIRTC